MKKMLALVPAAAIAAVASPALAQVTGPDYSTLTSNIDFGTTTTALLAVGALLVTVAVVVMGIRKIKGMVR